MKGNRILSSLSAFADLIKYKLSFAVVLSSVTGYFLCSSSYTPHLIFLAFGIFLLSSGSAALNQYTERVTDSIMDRTKNRPIPSKKISEKTALWVSALLLSFGCIVLFFNGFVPLLLGIFTVFLYNLIYTRLKKITVASIIPGALVGALPPMIGFSSAGGQLNDFNIIAFAGFIFLWQLPHFWLIILKYGKEYRVAGFTTISKYLTDIQIRYLVFFWVLFSTGFLFLFFSFADAISKNMFMLLALLNLCFIFFFYRLLFVRKDVREISFAFFLVNSFSFLIMVLLIALSILNAV